MARYRIWVQHGKRPVYSTTVEAHDLKAAKEKAARSPFWTGEIMLDTATVSRLARAREGRRYGDRMTRMHFKRIAETLGSIRDKKERERETARWIPQLRQENPRFDTRRFRAAVDALAARHGSFGNRRRQARNSRGRFTRR